MQFPELSMWRELLEKLRVRIWTPDPDAEEEAAPKRSKWDETAPAPAAKGPSGWAKNWRRIIKAVLPRGIDGTTPLTDPEVRKMVGALWKDVAAWAREQGLDRHLGLFTSDPVRQADGTIAPAADEWCFVPAADLLLTVGDAIVGVTVEGVFADNKPGHEPVSYAEALAGSSGKEKKRRSRSKSRSKDRDDPREDGDRDNEKKKQQEAFGAFDWENEWRNRANKRRRARSFPRNSPGRERYRSRSRDRDRDRDRRRKDRSRSRRRSRSGGRRGRRDE